MLSYRRSTLKAKKYLRKGKKKEKEKKYPKAKKIKEEREIEEELFLPLRSRGPRKIRKLPHFGAR